MPVDFLSSKKGKISKRSKIFLIVGLLILILGVIVTLNLGPALSLYRHARSGRQSLTQAQGALEEQQLEQVAQSLKEASRDLSAAQESLERLRWLEQTPYISKQIKALRHLLLASVQITSCLEIAVDSLQDILKPALEAPNLVAISSGEKGEVLKRLRQNTPSFERALTQVELAEIELTQVSKEGLLRQIQEVRDQISNTLPKIKKATENAVLLSRLVPGVTGYPELQTYLFLFQNNTELRPTGGFWGSYGVLRVKNGEIDEFWTDDTYNLDKQAEPSGIPKPWQLVKLSYADPDWYFRDANWNPDFPISAEKAEWFYYKEGGKEEFDGVLAITPTFIESLLEVTGPIELKDWGYTFESKDFTKKIQYFVEKRYRELGIPLTERKGILGDLSRNLFDKILLLPRERWTDFFNVIQDNLNQKQILLYIHNKETQDYVKEQNWGGEVKRVFGDYLLVVDSNMASLKTDAYIDRNINYELMVDESGQAKAKVSISYKNNAPGHDWNYTRYRTWSRIYVPKGSELISVSGNEKNPAFYKPDTPYNVSEELGKTVFGSLIVIEPGKEKTLIFEYKLPDNVIQDKKYTLLIQKQPGVIQPGLKVNLALPKKIRSYSPEDKGRLTEEKKIEFNWDLLVDREFKVTF